MQTAKAIPAKRNRKKNILKTKEKQLTLQLFMAVLLSLGGMALLFMGFWCSPVGKIDNSVLIGFGEVATFAGALFGVDWRYKKNLYRMKKHTSDAERDL